jgi:hypothetical protein
MVERALLTFRIFSRCFEFHLFPTSLFFQNGNKFHTRRSLGKFCTLYLQRHDIKRICSSYHKIVDNFRKVHFIISEDVQIIPFLSTLDDHFPNSAANEKDHFREETTMVTELVSLSWLPNYLNIKNLLDMTC